MQKWEYTVAACVFIEKTEKWQFICNNREFSDTQVMLNTLGAEGWELVTTFPLIHTNFRGLPSAPRTYTYYVEMHLKRPKES